MKLLILFSLLFASCDLRLSTKVPQSNPRAHTLLGPVEGFYNSSYGGRIYEAYQGVPFAQPPIGNLRFEVPKTASPWDGVLMAKEFSSSCIQYDLVPQGPDYRISGSEDCLYLNIYTPAEVAVDSNSCVGPNGTRRNLLPVIFFIHGGDYTMGSGSLYGPRYFMDRDVTLVTINYRLGPLGFLSTEDEIVPGNMGLKDQVMALRWVKDNVQSFGGDPSRVTIFGNSVGGSSVQFHYLTNMTAGLFQRGMSLSGTGFNPWSFIKNPLDKAKRLAAAMGCPIDEVRGMVHCLKYRPVHQMVDAVRVFTEWLFYASFRWGPVVEKVTGCESTFMDRSPVDIILSGDGQDLPWITGIVSEESAYPEGYFESSDEIFRELDDRWETLAPYILIYQDTIPESDQWEVGHLIRQHYFGDSPISRATFNQTLQLLDDRGYVYHFEEAVRSMALANQSPVYTYYFSYRGAHSYSETVTTEKLGPSHGDDLAYVFETLFDPTTTDEDLKMQKVLVDLWVSYATDGMPDVGVEWPRFNQCLPDEEFAYLHIAGPEDIGMESTANFGEITFWQSIPFEENIPSERDRSERT